MRVSDRPKESQIENSDPHELLRVLMKEHEALLEEMRLLIREFREHASQVSVLIDALHSTEQLCSPFKM